MSEHDFTTQRWGWHYEVWKPSSGDPAKEPTHFTGHGYGLKVGDHLLTEMQSGRVGRWLIKSVRYEHDPRDMWWAEAVLDGYLDARAT